jgi:hypothetical protein
VLLGLAAEPFELAANTFTDLAYSLTCANGNVLAHPGGAFA